MPTALPKSLVVSVLPVPAGPINKYKTSYNTEKQYNEKINKNG